MTRHTLTVGRERITFEMHPYPVGERCMVVAPGVAPFDVDGPYPLTQARDILRSVYAEDASQ